MPLAPPFRLRRLEPPALWRLRRPHLTPLARFRSCHRRRRRRSGPAPFRHRRTTSLAGGGRVAPEPYVPFPPSYLEELCNPKGSVEFVAQEEDLKSDEALWALYERWCKAFNQKLDHEEMMRANRDGHEGMLAKKVGNSSVLWKLDGSFLTEVFADFKVVNGKLFVVSPVAEEELSTNYEVLAGRLFEDLAEGHELVIPNDEFITRRPR
ncbi:hypothetical protein BAE44_0003824 [Dichanthelium oligosanthes]|uniref:Cathepsin propeptide inhibitor domain-containing protein n=1 Tax=Dichanthelium oligosanthes TaxID=888268 RepID=A0A1E5WCK7_9POAL|nr:hypothetical protein BAE44_0003824 [Dichanthelium oligosanthes]